MSKYLLEIGVEELPCGFIPQAAEQLKKGFKNFFEENKAEHKSIEVFATPRRLTVIVDGLSEKQPDEEKILKGPIKHAAYDEKGALTNAGKGFLAKNGINENNTYIENEYLHAKVFIKGKLISELLQKNAAQIVLKLQGPYFMRWAGANEVKFSRPVRWIVSILDDKEIPVQIVDVKSSKISRGHRFSPQKIVKINNPDEYIEKLRRANVIVNQEERKNKIETEIKKISNSAVLEQNLLEEVTYLCEWPTPCVCEFDKKYLEIPEKVIVTVMAKHQRYFPVYKDGKLTNRFITITNYTGDDFANIKAGNERVITARLEDAIFFFGEDTKKPLADYVEDLKGMTFQKNMGTMYDKTQRIIELSKIIGKKAGCDSLQQAHAERTARLCKADLAARLVFEFTELQGFIGSDYAKISGEDENVCTGIKEHYYPLNADSELAQSPEGQIVGIADKLDTVCAVFAGGKIPTGSSDPLGVRRAALGIIRTILSQTQIKPDIKQQSRLNLTNKTAGASFTNLNLSELIEKTIELIGKNVEIKQIEEFFVQRLIILLSDKYRKNILEACSKNKNPLENLIDFIERVEFIERKINTKEFAAINESANRILRILETNFVEKEPEISLFACKAEKELFNKINEIDRKKIENKEYGYLFDKLVEINPAIETFFNDVLVMDKDEKIKQNRFALLAKVKKMYNFMTDFSSLQI